jgi:iron complex outermembrane receptor protein
MKPSGRQDHHAFGLAAAIAALTLLSPGYVEAETPVQEYKIPAGDLGEALRAFGAASNTQILFSPEVVAGRRSQGISGQLSVEAAMNLLLANTSLTYRVTASNVILVTPAKSDTLPPTGAPPASSTDSRQGMGETPEDVIVTASKRLENIQDVPASVLVVTQSAMERSNVRDFDDLVKVAPSVTITKTSQPGNNSINIRGIGTYAYSIATEHSVAVVVD